MRRFRARSRRAGGKKRKTYWRGLQFAAQDANIDGALTASAWASWPAGYRDPQSDELMPNDETWSRCLVGGIIEFQAASPPLSLLGPHEAVFGLIAWDTIHGEDFDSVIGFDAPNPCFSPGLDWIMRIPFTYSRDGTQLVIAADKWIESRAMRKLPPGTGVLACVGHRDILVEPSESQGTFTFQFDVRYLLRSGYYNI